MARTGLSAPVGADMIDLRSDTVTRPSIGMREAMARAEVGDDVFGDDPTVRTLEERVAELLGKQAGLLVPSGTQSNLCAMLSHCGRGEEYIAGRSYHVFSNEAGGAAVLGSIAPHPIAIDERGAVTPEDIRAAIKPDDPHCPISRLLCLENTVSGRVQEQTNLEACAGVAKEFGLSVHLDGARLMNAAVKQNRSAGELAAVADSVSLCLSKGLGTPLGSVLVGDHDFIKSAYRWRKMLGGGMRQSGVVAAAGLYALDYNIDRLAEDHANAAKLANGLAKIDGLECDPSSVETNMVFVTPPKGSHAELCHFLHERGIGICGDHGAIRLVTHLDIDQSQIDDVVSAFAAFMGEKRLVAAA